MVHLWWGLLGAAVGTFRKRKRKDKAEDDDEGYEYVPSKRFFIAFAASAIQGVVLFVILCPVCILYVFGLYISAGASMWRLIKHDFGNDGGANMKPALQVLYSLAVAQGALFGYKTIHTFAAKAGLVKFVCNKIYKSVAEELVEEYLEETVAGCEKDPSFVTGRNLITYSVDLMMEAKTIEGLIAGVKVLGGAIRISDRLWGRKVLAKYLLTGSDSSSRVIQRLLETVGPRSPYSKEIKEHAVRILDIIAPCIRLEQFPQAIECLCSVADTSENGGIKDFPTYIYSTSEKHRDEIAEKLKDYERVELLEEYEKDNLRDQRRIDCLDFFLSTLKECIYQCLPCKWQHCLLGKRKTVENKREENVRRGFDQLLIKATNIIHKLVAEEDNRWTMRACVSNTVLHKIAMLPLKLHNDNHYPCRVYHNKELQMLEQCWVLTEWLLVALTETSSRPPLPGTTPVGEGQQRRRRSEEIEEVEQGEEQLLLRSMVGSALRRAIKHTIKDSIESTVKCIFDCLDCRATQKRQAIQILFHLSLDMSLDSESSTRRLSWILLLILLSGNDSRCWMVPSLTHLKTNNDDFDGIRRKAREKLRDMLREKHGEPSEETATELQLIGLALIDLKSAFYDDSGDISIRTHAIIIMQDLCRLDCIRYSEVVEGFLEGAIPKVVKETLILCGFITAERQDRATDEEKGEVSQDNPDGCIDIQPLRRALTSLCAFGYMSYYSGNLNCTFPAIASKTCEEQGTSFEDFDHFLRTSVLG